MGSAFLSSTANSAAILAGTFAAPGWGGQRATYTDVTAPADGSSAGALVYSGDGCQYEVTVKCPAASAESVRFTLDGTAPSSTVGVELVAGGGVVVRGSGDLRVWSSGGTGTVSVIREPV